MPPSVTKARPKETSAEVAKFRRNLGYYAANCLFIVTKQARLEKFVFNREQEYLGRKVAEHLAATGSVRAIVLKARQLGVSTWVAARFYRRATLYSNQNIMVIADQKKRSGVLFGIYETFHRYLPEQFRPRKRYGAKASQLVYDTISGPGGLNSKITVETAKDVDAGRASTIHALHGSEVASWENAEDLWIGLAQSIPFEGAEVFLESTAKGVGNFFHQMWEDAVSGLNGYIAIFIPWFAHEEYRVANPDTQIIASTLTAWEREAMETGIEWDGEMCKLDYGQIAWRRQIIRDNFRGDERSFRQEHPSTAREAFLVSGNIFFDEDALSRYEESTRPPLFRCNLLQRADVVLPVRSERGYLRVFEQPRQEGIYVIGADTASGKEISPRETAAEEKGGRDFNCAPVYDASSGAFVAELHGRMAPEVFAEQLDLLGRYYATGFDGEVNSRYPSLVGVEKNHSSGETTLRHLKDVLRYPNLYYSRPEHKRNVKVSDTLGWSTNVVNRQRMLDELSQAMRENAVAIPSADAVREMFTFARDESGKPVAQEGCHDDRVMSYAITLQLARFARRRRRGRLTEIEYSDTPAGFG